MSKPTIEEMVKALEKSWYFTYPKDGVYSAAETEVYRIHIERCFKAIRTALLNLGELEKQVAEWTTRYEVISRPTLTVTEEWVIEVYGGIRKFSDIGWFIDKLREVGVEVEEMVSGKLSEED